MDHPKSYVIRVRGAITSRLQKVFEEFGVTLKPNGETVITGEAIDQATLHGILNRIRDFGLEILSVQQTGPDSDKESSS